jgi:hypothetical protein
MRSKVAQKGLISVVPPKKHAKKNGIMTKSYTSKGRRQKDFSYGLSVFAEYLQDMTS